MLCPRLKLNITNLNFLGKLCIESETITATNIVARGEQQIKMKQPFCNKENMKHAHGRHDEHTIYNLNRSSDPAHKVIEHSNASQLNFKLLSHRFACEREGKNDIVETLCSCEFNVEML